MNKKASIAIIFMMMILVCGNEYSVGLVEANWGPIQMPTPTMQIEPNRFMPSTTKNVTVVFTTTHVNTWYSQTAELIWFGYQIDKNAAIGFWPTLLSSNLSPDGYNVCKYRVSLTGLAKGSHKLKILAKTNSIMGMGADVGSIIFSDSIDINVRPTAPTIIITSPTQKTYNTSTVEIRFDTTERLLWSGYSLDNQANVTFVGKTTINGLSDGYHQVTVYGNGTDGLMRPSSIIAFEVDTTAPSLLVTLLENKTYNSSNVPITLAVNETASWIGYSLDNQANVTTIESFTLMGLAEGAHSIKGFAIDNMGNVGASNTTWFSVDTMCPKPKILAPENFTYQDSKLILNFTVDDPTSTFSYSLNGQQNLTAYANMTEITLSPGTNNITIYATDATGNIGKTETITFTVIQEEDQYNWLSSPRIVGISASISLLAIGFAAYMIRRRHRSKVI